MQILLIFAATTVAMAIAFNLSFFRCLIPHNNRKIYDKSLELDILNMRKSTSMPLYSKVRTHCIRDNYLNYTINWNAIRTFIQLRSNLGYFSTPTSSYKLGILSNFYNNCIPSICNCCTRKLTEDMYHVMFNCPLYHSIREKYLSNYVIPQTEREYLEFFVDPEPNKITDVNFFVMSMLDLRYRTLNEEHNLDLVNYYDSE
jgi:hypothetical protein